MQSHFVSVIVPAYNAAGHLRATLEAALAQTYPAFEVVVVDDGSTDSTAELVSAMAHSDARLRLLRQANAGVAAARNAGIDASSGSLVALLDADDRWHPDKLRLQVARMHEVGPHVGVVYTDFEEIDAATGQKLGAPLHDLPEGDLSDVFVYRNPIPCASTPLIRRTCLEQVGGFSPLMRAQGGQGCEDWDLYLRLAEVTRFAVVPDMLVTYRRVAGSMAADAAQMHTSYRIMMRRLRARRPDVPRVLLRRSRQRFAFYMAGIHRRQGRHLEAAGQLLRALLAHPSALVRNAKRRAEQGQLLRAMLK